MRTARQKFEIDRFVELLEKNYETWNPPIVTFVSNRGASPFQVLVSTLLSLRTKDEVTGEACRRLFAVARTPQEILALDEETLMQLIYPVGFYPTKTKRLREICRILIEEYNGQVPDTINELLKLPGVGRKTANLVLVEAYKRYAICVDTHVHRISNRIGYVQTKTPDDTEMALRKKLPLKYWRKYNELLVAFGQVVCRPISPFCSKCPVEKMCPKRGVEKTR
ncbi:MAG: endonuclease III [Thermodesulfobacteriota bacterium]|nr:endonuclease III [Thermodesulfobacteriota bacterium]